MGNGTEADSPLPLQVRNLTGVTAIAAGGHFSLALKSDGAVWTWGSNVYGQLGNGRSGRNAYSDVPVRAGTELWSRNIPLTGKAMALAEDVLFVAGTPVAFPSDDLAKAYEGRMGGVLWAASAATGEKLAEYKLDAPPAWDGMAVANGRLYISLQDGRVMCMSGK